MCANSALLTVVTSAVSFVIEDISIMSSDFDKHDMTTVLTKVFTSSIFLLS